MEIKVKQEEREYSVLCRTGQTILDALKEKGETTVAFCGGRGTCGKCRIRIREGSLPVTEFDKKVFSDKELKDGWRLACQAVPVSDCTIENHMDREDAFEVLSAFSGENKRKSGQNQEYGIAVDIGTTTIAMVLTGLQDGEIYASHSMVNRQRIYGADVITRIQASVDGKGAELQKLIRDSLNKGIESLIKKGNVSGSQIKKVILTGNTTMEHLFMGYSCASLGVYPFTPVNIETITGKSEEFFECQEIHCQVVLMPGISTYVGADIVSGILDCQMAEKQEISLLLDLGTNGEMAIGNKERILTTSTAAGPAFEGGCISCGMGSVPGAISSVEINGSHVSYKTIGDKKPLGLCGTGVVETTAELLRENLIDEAGALDESCKNGFVLAKKENGEIISFTQKDVREIQLAKSAVRAGMETLLLRYGITKEQVDTVYIAGGFGFKLSLEKAVMIGLLPEEFQRKTKILGNSALGGAVKYLTEPDAAEKAEKIKRIAEEIGLSKDKDFNELYMEHMFFDI